MAVVNHVAMAAAGLGAAAVTSLNAFASATIRKEGGSGTSEAGGSVAGSQASSSASKSKLVGGDGLICEWAMVFHLTGDDGREAAWRLRTGPDQIEFIDDILATAARSRGNFPRKNLDLKIYESWLEFRVAMLNGLLELLSSPNCKFRCELFRSVSRGPDAKSTRLIVLVRLPDDAAFDHAERLGYLMPLAADVPLKMRLPVQGLGHKVYPAGPAKFNRKWAAHYWDTHDGSLYALVATDAGGKGVFGMTDRVRLMSDVVQEHIDLTDLIAAGVVTGHFPLHCAKLKDLARGWARLHLIFSWSQPLAKIRAYFGSQIAFYFAWVGFQAKALFPLAVAGACIEVWTDWRSSAWALTLHILCGAAVVFWSSIYLRAWARREAVLRAEWAYSVDKKGMRHANPNYKGTLIADPVTGVSRRKYSPWKKRIVRILTRSVTLIFIGVSTFGVFSIFQLQAYMEREDAEHIRFIASLLPPALNAVQIKVLELIWNVVSWWLVEMENYRTLESRRDALIWKMFVFRAINAFSSCFWIAFVKRKTSCNEKGDCIAALRFQLVSVFAAYNGVTIGMDILLPWLSYWRNSIREDGIVATAQQPKAIWRKRSSVERQADMMDYDWRASVEDYVTVALQFGLVLFFFSALPGIATLALASHLLQIRADAFKLCCTLRRPFPEEASGAGAWNDVMALFARVAAIVSPALVIFTTGLMQDRTQAEKWLMLVCSERAAALLSELVDRSLSERPSLVKISRKRHEVVMELLQDDRVRCSRCGDNNDGHSAWPRIAAEADKHTEDTQPPFYVLGRDPRMLSDALLAPHLRVKAARPRRRRTSRRRRQWGFAGNHLPVPGKTHLDTGGPSGEESVNEDGSGEETSADERAATTGKCGRCCGLCRRRRQFLDLAAVAPDGSAPQVKSPSVGRLALGGTLGRFVASPRDRGRHVNQYTST